MAFSTGQRLTADALNAATAQYGIRLIQQAAQSLTSSGTAPITYGTGSEDFAFNAGTSWHSTSVNTSRVTPDVAGWYACEAVTHMAVGATSYTQIIAAIGKNGTRVDPQPVMRPDPSAAATSAITAALVYCNGSTDYLEHFGQQISGGANNTSTTTGFRCTFTVRLWRRD